MTECKTTEDHRRCNRCGVLKPLTEFYLTPKGKAYSRCKVCQQKIIRAREKARAAGGKQDKHGKEIGNTQTLPTTPGHKSYVSTVIKNATEMVSDIRDAAFNMADQLAKTHDVAKLTIKDAYSLAVSLKQLNDIILTNSLFLKNNIDLSSLSDDELLALADAMTVKAKESKATHDAEVVDVEEVQ